MIKTGTWVIATAAALIILALLSLFLLNRRGEGHIVQVVQDGVVVREIDLSRVTGEYSFTLEWKGGGSNVITVRPGKIRVSEADCPDHICMEQGWLTDQAAPIVCMPHKLMIRLKSAGDTAADAVVN